MPDGLVAAGGVSPGHDDVGAVQGQAGGGGAADAAVAAGDQGYRSDRSAVMIEGVPFVVSSDRR
jgi:hypothetical protein